MLVSITFYVSVTGPKVKNKDTRVRNVIPCSKMWFCEVLMGTDPSCVGLVSGGWTSVGQGLYSPSGTPNITSNYGLMPLWRGSIAPFYNLLNFISTRNN